VRIAVRHQCLGLALGGLAAWGIVACGTTDGPWSGAPDGAASSGASGGDYADGAAGAGHDGGGGLDASGKGAPGDARSNAASDGATGSATDGGVFDAATDRAATTTPTGDAATTAAQDGGGIDAGWWRPGPGTTWQWQLSGTLDTSLGVAMYDIDMFTNDAKTVAALKARRIRVVCYIDVGTYEPGRPDSSQFPAAVVGSDVQGWPGEKWLDVTAPAVQSIMQARFQLAQQKGCDGVEPDNVDGYQNSPGFSTTAAQQATYNTWVATSVHALGMAVALKNDTGQVTQLEPSFDFALDEQCFQYSECSTLMPFIKAGKAVFEVEYGDAGLATTVCPQANTDRFDTLVKDLNLDAWRVSCE
jgi:hypothetical protein